MSEKYIIDYAINGSFEVEADSAEEAQSKFDTMGVRELSEFGELEALGDPETQAQRDAYWENFKSKVFPKSRAAANG